MRYRTYAPLFVNVNPGGMQWSPDLIGYDTLNSYGSPSYYAQKMFSTSLGDGVLSVTCEHIPTQTWQPPAKKARRGAPPSTLPAPQQLPTLFYVATKDSKTGAIYLKVVNTAGAAAAGDQAQRSNQYRTPGHADDLGLSESNRHEHDWRPEEDRARCYHSKRIKEWVYPDIGSLFDQRAENGESQAMRNHPCER